MNLLLSHSHMSPFIPPIHRTIHASSELVHHQETSPRETEKRENRKDKEDAIKNARDSGREGQGLSDPERHQSP